MGSLHKKSVAWVFAGVLLCLGFAGTANAQEQTGSITGVVKDASGSVLPGVTVEVRSASTGVSSTTTDENGVYRFPALPPGTYQISATLQGFQTVTNTAVVELGKQLSVELSMKLAGVTEAVTVTGEAPVVDVIAIQEEINTFKGVNRIIRHAFEFARTSGRRKVCMADKSNAMQQGHALWQRVFKQVASEYPDVEATHYYIDALAMYMVRDPSEFEVIVTNNLFGDIVTDLGAQLQGGLGLAASGNIHPGRTSMFEPVHGSAPPMAGRNVANPIGAILSAALMCEHLGLAQEARAIESAVRTCVIEGRVTADAGGTLGTRETGAAVCDALKSTNR